METRLAAYIEETPRTKPLSKEWRKKLFDQKKDVEVLAKYRQDQAHVEARKQLYGDAVSLILAGHAVPPVGSFFDGVPTTTTEIARQLADRIGFAIMPLRYLRDSMYPSEYYERRNLDAWIESGLPLWVMAPVTGYSLEKHLKSKDHPIHVPEDVSQAFMALGMSIPVFRAMQRQLDELREHVRDYHQRVENLASDVQALRTRVDSLAMQAAAERARRNAEAAEFKKRQEEILAWYRSPSDPLVLALPAGKTIRDDVSAFIGPCWGELPKTVVKALAITPRRKLPAVRRA